MLPLSIRSRSDAGPGPSAPPPGPLQAASVGPSPPPRVEQQLRLVQPGQRGISSSQSLEGPSPPPTTVVLGLRVACDSGHLSGFPHSRKGV